MSFALLGGAALVGLASPALAQSRSAIQAQLDELKKVIEQQQRTIDQLQKQLGTIEGAQVAVKEQAQAAVTKADEAAALAKAPPGLVSQTKGAENVKVTVAGQIHRMINVADDGKNTKAYFVDNNQNPSRVITKAEARVTEDLKATGQIEVAFSPNNSNQVSQTAEIQSSSQTVDIRKVEVIFEHAKYGSLYFGRGDPSTKDIARIDLSGTSLISYPDVQDTAGGLFFATDGSYSPTTIANVFTDLDPSRENRIRYDTPAFYGVVLSGTGAANQNWNFAGRWAGKAADFEGQAGVGISDPNQQDVNFDLAGSASVIHTPTGLNLTAAAGYQDQEGAEPVFFFIKPGWRADFFSLGKTSFSVDYQRTLNRPDSSSVGNSVGVYAVQNFAKYGLDIYAGMRWYSLDQDDNNYDDIWMGTVGTRIKF